MIASTPIDGGHYFCDAIAGIAIALLCWFAARQIVRAYQKDRPASLSALADTPSIVPGIATTGSPVIASPDLDPVQSDGRANVTQAR